MHPFPIYYGTHGRAGNSCILLVNGSGGQLILWPAKFIEGLVNQGAKFINLLSLLFNSENN